MTEFEIALYEQLLAREELADEHDYILEAGNGN